jgi:hypothetical protein
MESNVPAAREEHALVPGTTGDLHSDHRDPQAQEVQQNLWAAMLPLAILAFLLVSFVAAAWTFIAASPA